MVKLVVIVEEDTMEDINSNRHMDRIRDSMLVIIRYILFSRSSLFIPLRTSLLPTRFF